MPLIPLRFRAGINREGTDYSNEGGWYDANLVRFRKGYPEKIGGWSKDISSTFKGSCRALHAWVDLQGTKWLGLGTHLKYYVSEGNAYSDITPIRTTTSAGDVTFGKEENGSAQINVTDASHGAVKNDFVTFSGAATLGGLITAAVLNQEYQIATITSANVYTIEAKDTDGDEVTANSSDSGNGGSSVVGAYQLNTGLDTYVESSGWGAGLWGDGTWGSTSALSFTNQLRLWSHDNFGEDLLLNPRNGGIFYWDASDSYTTVQRAVNLTSEPNANLVPTVALQVVTSDVSRHLLALGADPISGSARTGTVDPLFVCWCDQENLVEWEPKSTNSAGSFRLSAGSSIVGSIRARQEILVWTDNAMYQISYVGLPYVFASNLINEGTGLIGPNACINTPKGVFWADLGGFYVYNGSVQLVPCSVLDYVFSDLNKTQSYKVFAFSNTAFDEVGWFYCSSSSDEIDKYVLYNYEDQTWTIGQLARQAWLDEGVARYPRATSSTGTVAASTGYLYQQENGNDADGSSMDNVYIESSDFDIAEGEEFQFINRIIPDVNFTGSAGTQQINFVLKTRNYPGASLATNSTNNVTNSTEKVNVRARARQATLRVQSDDDADSDVREGVGWRLGVSRMDVRPNGKR